MSYREPEAGSMFLRREEGVEQPVHIGRRTPLAAIDDSEHDRSHFQPLPISSPSRPSGLASIALITRFKNTCSSCSGSHFDTRQAWLDLLLAVDRIAAKPVTRERQNIIENPVESDRLKVRRAGTREIEKIREEAIQPLTFSRDDVDALRVLRIQVLFSPQDSRRPEMLASGFRIS